MWTIELLSRRFLRERGAVSSVEHEDDGQNTNKYQAENRYI